MIRHTRRSVVAGMGLAAAGALLRTLPGTAQGAATSPFRLAVINDELTQDFERACQIAAQDFGLQWIELRTMWGKNVTALDDKDVKEARRILARYKLRVTDLATPVFKADWPGAPVSKQSERRDQFKADYDAAEQDRLLEKCITLAHSFGTDRIRVFDYWRLDDVKPYRAAINAKLDQAATRCAKDKVVMLLENEMSCNTGTGEEAAATLAAIPNRNLMLNWDPGNAAALHEKAFPVGYDALPKDRIGHCHAKDVVYQPDGKFDWAPVGGGVVDWVGQLEALKRDGFHYGLSLETHWKGGGTPEASSRVSMAGLKKSLHEAGIAAPATA